MVSKQAPGRDLLSRIRPGMKGIAHGRAAFCASLLITTLAASAGAADYSICTNWAAMDQATDAKYATARRISGSNGYTGFWFFGAGQFDASNRYAHIAEDTANGPK